MGGGVGVGRGVAGSEGGGGEGGLGPGRGAGEARSGGWGVWLPQKISFFQIVSTSSARSTGSAGSLQGPLVQPAQPGHARVKAVHQVTGSTGSTRSITR